MRGRSTRLRRPFLLPRTETLSAPAAFRLQIEAYQASAPSRSMRALKLLGFGCNWHLSVVTGLGDGHGHLSRVNLPSALRRTAGTAHFAAQADETPW